MMPGKHLPKEKTMSATPDLICYKTMPVWTKNNIPPSILSRHNTKAGTWGKLRVIKGRVKFHEMNEAGETLAEHILTPQSEVWTITPQAWHKAELLDDDSAFQLEFHCEKKDYFSKKYGMTATHSAVVDAARRVPPGKALDLGCGQGRNALYLGLLGFDVTASDYNPAPLAALEDMADAENLRVQTCIYDMNTAALAENYDFLVATVVFMFLDAGRVPAIIENMQAHTTPGGYNLIVSAMDTEDHPCVMPFSFTFREGELKKYYEGWEMAEYREEIGSMHATDAQGKPIQLKFVTMLARKPA